MGGAREMEGSVTDNVMDIVRLWRRLAEEWRGRRDAARGPIEAALLKTTLPLDLQRVGVGMAYLARERRIDPRDMLRFLRRPYADGSYENAAALVDEVALSVNVALSPAASASMAPPGDSDLLTIAEAAKAAKVDEKTIRRMIRSQRLPATPFGSGTKRKNYRIKREDLLKLSTSAETTAAASAEIPAARPHRRRGASPASAYLPRVAT
jgi:excisionase family DNA binding protein